MATKKPRSGNKEERHLGGTIWRKKRGLHEIALLALALLLSGGWLLTGCQPADEVTPAEVIAEIIPQEGDSTAYDIPLSLDNTSRFIDYYSIAALTSEQKRVMRDALLPLKAPCCDDNSMLTCCCPCNLAKSVWGLSNYLIVEENYSADQVRESVLQWLRFIHSDYYVIQELQDQGVDPSAYGLSHEDACYVGNCELPFEDNGCGGMGKLTL